MDESNDLDLVLLLLISQQRQLAEGLNFDDAAILQKLTEIRNDLAYLKAQTSTTVMQIISTPISPAYSQTGLWTNEVSSLDTITDGNITTATNYGEGGSQPGNLSYFNIDLGTPVFTPFSIVEALISIQNSNGQESYWGVEIEQQQGVWDNIWGVHRAAPSIGDTQIFKQLIVKGSWQRLRFVLKHTGNGIARFKIFSIRMFTVS